MELINEEESEKESIESVYYDAPSEVNAESKKFINT